MGPSVFYALSALNGPTWAFSRCSANYHLGFTEPYNKMVCHGLHFCHKMVNSMSMPSCLYMTMLTLHVIAMKQMPGTPT